MKENILDEICLEQGINIPPKGCGVPALLLYFINRIDLGRAEFAGRTGVTVMHVSRWLRGYPVLPKYIPVMRDALHLNKRELSRLEEEIELQNELQCKQGKKGEQNEKN